MDDYIAKVLLLGAKVEMRSQDSSTGQAVARQVRSHYKKIRKVAIISKAQRSQKALLYLESK